MNQAKNTDQSLVLGATGYVGGRLVPLLLERGVPVRAASRSTNKLRARSWAGHPGCETVRADVFDTESLARALDGCRTAFYLVHSMLPGATKGFEDRDRRAAENMDHAARLAGVERIIYLGGLGAVDADHSLSAHLRSRHEVGEILQQGQAELTWLRAAMIIGSGSASFEILRYLADRLPIMITPRWVRTRVQPIAISNVLGYLAGCLDNPATAGGTFDIGGPDVHTYESLFQLYARLAGLRRRWIIPVPVLSPKLSSYWINLVTPLPPSLARPLAEGLRNEVVCTEHRIRSLVPQDLLDCEQAIGRALRQVRLGDVRSRWSDAGDTALPHWPELAHEGDASYAGGAVREISCRAVLGARPLAVWQALESHDAPVGNVWWAVGTRQGRRDIETLLPGDAVNGWRVVEARPGTLLRMVSEARLPGEAVMDYALTPAAPGTTEVAATLRFRPRGLAGLAGWFLAAPLLSLRCRGRLRGLAHRLLVSADFAPWDTATPAPRTGNSAEAPPGPIPEMEAWAVARTLLRGQRSGVLATSMDNVPYASRMAFAISDDLDVVYLATPRRTRKHGNMTANPRAALLVDNTRNRPGDTDTAEALTLTGTMREATEKEQVAWAELFAVRHPILADFAHAEDTAMMRMDVEEIVLVRDFQATVRLVPPAPGE